MQNHREAEKNSFKRAKGKKENCRLLERPNKIKLQANPLLSQQVLHTIPGYLSKSSCLSPTGHTIPPLKQDIPPFLTCQAHLGDAAFSAKPLVSAGEAKQFPHLPLTLGRWHPQSRRYQRHLGSVLIIRSSTSRTVLHQE